MTHRYLRPTWWVQRLAPAVERVLPPPWIMPALGWAVRHGSEPELGGLAGIVPADRIAVDVGAADGVYTWCLARLAAACVAFEANPESADRIRRRVPQATVHAVALSDQEGEILLRVPVVSGVPYAGWGTIEPENKLAALAHQSIEAHSVPMRTLDSFALRNVGFIKIDVEGHELAVLRGGTETIRRWRPAVLIEVEDRHRDGALASVNAWFRQEGYAVSRMPGLSCVDERKYAPASERNFLFRPG